MSQVCHTELHPMSNIAYKVRRICPKCGKSYYENENQAVELYKMEMDLDEESQDE